MILQILGFSAFGAILQNFDLWQTMLTKLNLQRKPFNCTLCWTFWMSLAAYLGQGNNLINSVCFSATSAVLAELIDRKLNNF